MNVVIGDSVANINREAFYQCALLTNVVVGKGVTDIGRDVFYSCTNLTGITVDELNSAYSSLDGVLFNKSQTTLIQCPGGKVGNYTIPESVTRIGMSAFYFCTGLTGVTIPNSVTTIGERAFDFCISVTGVTIPTNVTTIDRGTFASCTSLTNITIPSGVTNIGHGAFSVCTSLNNLIIPSSVNSIRTWAFHSCSNLTGVYFLGNAPYVEDRVFYQSYKVTVYYLPGTTGWAAFSTVTGLAPALWKPQVQTSDDSFGVRTNQFGFNISWASGMVVAVEASTSPDNSIWTPLQTNMLTSDTLYFSDPHWTNYPTRFYRLRWP
jgi:hypothetical protein